ncbi:hypothetical protein APASM_1979 [Actinosynnema pretiosum subsp. pretiosum]|nr:hypothetical protein APASM_1979 [Actinosynnema pretiosum subsp. pretiosum]
MHVGEQFGRTERTVHRSPTRGSWVAVDPIGLSVELKRPRGDGARDHIRATRATSTTGALTTPPRFVNACS